MPPLPKTQTAVQITSPKPGAPPSTLILNPDASIPTPSPSQVLIKTTYAGVNYIDTYFRTALYPVPSLPYTIGTEGEGHIVALGSDVKKFEIGQRVAFLSASGGAQAEYAVADVKRCFLLPEERDGGVEEGLAAASMVQGLTAMALCKESYEVRKGDYVLIHASAGGVGLWLLQLTSLLGAHIIATASTSSKLALSKEFGAEFVINYVENKDWVSKVMEITGGKGVEAVFDGVGESTFDGSLQVLKRKGTMVSFGNAAGLVPPVELGRLRGKNLKIVRPSLFAYIETKEEFETYTKEMFDLIVSKKVKVKIHKVYPMKDVVKAHEDIESRNTTGKLLLKI